MFDRVVPMSVGQELLSVADAAAVITAARKVCSGVAGRGSRYAEADLGGLLELLLGLRAAVEGAALAVVVEAAARGVVTGSTAAGVSGWVAEAARVAGVGMSGPEAGRWANVAAECARPGGEALAAACMTGRVSVASGMVLARELRTIRSQVPEEVWRTCVNVLADHVAMGASARDLAVVRDAVVCQYGDRDWVETRAREAYARRRFTGFVPDGHGTYTARVTLDGDSVAQVDAVLTALSAPRLDSMSHENGQVSQTCHPARAARVGACANAPEVNGAGLLSGRELNGTQLNATQLDGTWLSGIELGGRMLDGRSGEQRRADALIEMAALVAQQGRLPQKLVGVGQGCAQVVVTMDFDRLRDACGYGLTVGGQPVAPSTVRRLACDSGVIPMVLGSSGQPLDVGRESRLASHAQIGALRERDKGCSFPGCDRPPGWTQAHHIHHWVDGGMTALSNLTLLCQRHHTIVHRDGCTATVTDAGVAWHGISRPPIRSRHP